MSSHRHLASLSLLVLSAALASSACTSPSPDDQDISVDDVADGDFAEGDEELGETQDELVYACSNVSNANWNDSWETLETQILAEINKLRAAGTTCGGVAKPKVPALTLNTALRCAARSHSKDMAEKNFFSHTGSDGTSAGTRFTQAGYTNWTAAGENIAAGNSTAVNIVNQWKNSTGHCNGMMSAAYVHFAVGYYSKSTAAYKHYQTLALGKK
jgi:uncharacterized protein YkwD